MNKFLLTSVAVAAALTATVQGTAQTYNYFDAADVDGDGWLWFDTQEKIDKYVGFGSDYKIQLQPVGYENENFEYVEPWADPEIPGYNISGEEAGEGAKFGAIVLNQSSVASGNGSDTPNGGGFMLWLPDCAKFDVFLSSGNDVIVVGLKAAMGEWAKPVDCATVKTWMKMGAWIKPLSNQYQFEFDDIQSYANSNTPYTTIASEAGKKVTALFTNNGKELYVHGMRIYTYTQTSGIISTLSDDVNVSVKDGAIQVDNEADITLYNIAGQPIAKAQGTSMSLDNIAAGVYVATAKTSLGTVTVKISK